jgi:hypothetical protein
VFEEIQALFAAAVPFPVRVSVLPMQSEVLPVIIGFEYTVTKDVTWHPLLLVYVIVVFPAKIAVINPFAEIVATPVLLDIQGVLRAAVALPVNCEVLLTQSVKLPDMLGLAFTCTGTLAEHPRFVVYVIVV